MSTVTLEDLTLKRAELAANTKSFYDSLKTNEAGVKIATNDDLEKLGKMRAELDGVGEKIAAMEFGLTMKKGGDGGYAWEQAPPPIVAALREEGKGENPSQVEGFTKACMDRFAESKWRKGKSPEEIEIEDKSVLDLLYGKATMTTTAGYPPEVTRDGTVYGAISRPPQLIDLLLWGTTAQNAIAYMSQTTRTNAAAARAENAAFAESEVAWTEQTAPVRSIGTYIPATEEQLEDAGEVESLLNIDLPLMARQVIDTQLLSGSGTAPNIRGIDNTVGIQTLANGSETLIDALATSMQMITTGARGSANLILMRTIEMWTLMKAKDTQGRYLLVDPGSAPRPMVWGVPIAPNDALTANRILTLDTAYWRPVWRKGVTVTRGLINDDFIKNKVCMKVDARIALKAPRPEACVRLTYTAP
jgi:HK97 family phage major capsid protein